MSRDPIEILFEKTDGLDLRTRILESDNKLTDHRLKVMEANHAEMCRQLVETEVKVMESIKKIGDKQDTLIRRFDVQDGVKSVGRFIPVFFQTVISVSTVIILIRSFNTH